MTKIADYIREIAGKSDDNIFVATVMKDSVSGNTCTVIPVDGKAKVEKVRLNADINGETGVLITPTDESYVLVGMLNPIDGMVLMFSEIKSISIKINDEISLLMDADKIEFNGGVKNSYLCDINVVKDKISALEQQLNDLKTVFSNWTPAPNDGGAALKAVSATWAAQTINPLTSVDDLKDDKIKH
jgi:hypothetical protein